jgi:hypothetical protein
VGGPNSGMSKLGWDSMVKRTIESPQSSVELRRIKATGNFLRLLCAPILEGVGVTGDIWLNDVPPMPLGNVPKAAFFSRNQLILVFIVPCLLQ